MIWSAVLLLVSAQVVGEPTAATAYLEVVLPEGTPVQLVTINPVHSRSIVQGQRIALEVAEDVLMHSKTVIPRGTPATGEIEALTTKGMFGKAAKFTLRPLFIEVGDRRINLIGERQERGARATAPAAVATVLTGGFGMIITGKSAELPAGSVINAELREDVVLRSK